MEAAKKDWVMPAITKFGSFNTATQKCIKQFGSSDGFTFQGIAVPIEWCGS